MRYKQESKNPYFSRYPRRRFSRFSLHGKGRVKRFLVQYGTESESDMIYVLAVSEREALLKARNVVKSLHPTARNITVHVLEEHEVPFKVKP